MPKPKRLTLKDELAAAQKANAILNTEIAALKLEKETLHQNLAASQIERLRLETIIETLRKEHPPK